MSIPKLGVHIICYSLPPSLLFHYYRQVKIKTQSTQRFLSFDGVLIMLVYVCVYFSDQSCFNSHVMP